MTPNPNPSLELREGEFLPCPFCGSGDPMFVQGSDDDGNWVAVVCPDCGVGSRQHYHVMEDAHPHAQNAWNTRALSQTLPAPGEDYVLVPRVPTTAMVGSAIKIIGNETYIEDAWRAMLAAIGPVPENAPIDMLLDCPRCGVQHIDEAADGWDNPPHRSHLCLACGHIWRPADVPTNGVAAIATRGSADSPTLATVAAANDEGVALDWRAVAKLAGEHGVRYRTNTALEQFLAAVALLPTIRKDNAS